MAKACWPGDDHDVTSASIATLRLGLVADGQSSDSEPSSAREPANRRFYRQSTAKLREAVDTFNHEAVDLVIHLGDLVDRAGDSFAVPHAALAHAAAPVVHVLGNHDLAACNGDRAEALRQLRMSDPYDIHDIGLHRIVVLDTNEGSCVEFPYGSEQYAQLELELSSQRSEGVINAHPWNGGIGTDQLAWLETTLTDAQATGMRVIILTHHPLVPMGTHTALNAAQILDVIDKVSCVAAVITGHDHAGSFGVRNNVVHWTLEGLVNTETNAYAVAEFGPEHLTISGFGRVRSRGTPIVALVGA